MKAIFTSGIKPSITWKICFCLICITPLLLFYKVDAARSFWQYLAENAVKPSTVAVKKANKKSISKQIVSDTLATFPYLPISPITQVYSIQPSVILVPTITAIKTVAVQGGGSAAAGGQLNYTIVLSNSGTVATGVSLTDVLSNNLTLVANSVKASPIAADDSYTSIGNVGITVNAASGLLANDIKPDNTSFTAAAVTNVATTNSGTISIATDGSFTYTPAAGYNGSDTYTYTLNSSNGLTSTGTVTFTVSTPIWFINSAYAGGGSNGTLAKPFTTVNAFQAINDGANTNRGENGDYIFVYAASYSPSVITLRTNQKLIGQAATASIVSITGITLPTFSNALPSTGGATTTIANTTATPVTLGSGNDVEGFTFSSTSGTTLSGASVGTLKIRDVTLSASAGQALLISAGGVLDVQFKSISAAGAGTGMSVKNSTGSFQVLGTGSTAGSGGVINNITNRGAEFVTCANVTLKNMNFTSANTSTTYCATPESDNSLCNAALHLQSISTSASLDNISITGTTNLMGLNLHNVTGLTLSNSTITASGSTSAQASVGVDNGGIFALNLGGTCSISNTNVNSSYGKNFHCRNGILSVNPTLSLTVSNCQFKNTFTNSSGGSNFDFEGYGSSNNTLVFKTNDFSNPKTYGLFLAFGNSSVNTVQVGGNTAGDGNTITAALTSPGSSGFALQCASNHTGSLTYNVINNTFQSSFNGVDIFNIGSQGSGATQGRCNFNTATAVNGVNSNGIYVALYGTGTHKAEVLNNTVTGTLNYGIGIESNDGNEVGTTGRMDATVKNNNVTMLTNAYAHVGVLAITTLTSGASLNTCANVGNNTTNSPVTGLATGHFDVLALNMGTSTAQISLQGTTAFSPLTPQPQDQTARLTTFWNANNVGTRTAIDEQGGGTIISGTCNTPSNPVASLLATGDSILALQKQNALAEVGTEKKSVKEYIEKATTEAGIPPQYNPKLPTGNKPQLPQALELAGETVTVNGAGSGFDLPAAKSTTITFSATISSTPSSCSITNQASVSGSNFTTVMSNTTTTTLSVAVVTSPTIGAASVCSGSGLTMSAGCPSGTLNWWTVSSGGSSVATGSPYNPTNVTSATSYYASCIVGSCESSRTLVGAVTIKALPNTSFTATPNPICLNSTLSLTGTAGATTYTWGGNGVVTANAAITTATPTATGSQVYSVTVTGSNGCSANTTTNVTVNSTTLPTSTNTRDLTLSGTSTFRFLGASGCDVLASVTPTGGTPIAGSTTARVWMDGTQNTLFVKRHYEITPTTNANTSTGVIILYFTQGEFDDFNAVNSIKLPINSMDAAGKANLLIEKIGGSTNNTLTGLPNTYTGTHTTIDPTDVNIVFNATTNLWEITFTTTGFSGFFVKTTGAPLPIELLSFTGKNTEGGNLLTWETASEKNNVGFEIERSATGKTYEKIGFIAGNGTTSTQNTYTFLDKNVLSLFNYYRLKQIDVDGTATYSNIINLESKKGNKTIKIYPNPSNKVLNIELPDLSLNPDAEGTEGLVIFNKLGQLMYQQKNKTQQTLRIDVQDWATGIYFIKSGAEVIKFVKN